MAAYCQTIQHVNAFNYVTQKWEKAVVCYHCEAGECKYEWGNQYENDGTPDNSYWTSIETDGIPGTSPSLDVYEPAASQDSTSQSSIDEVCQNPASEDQDSEYESEEGKDCTRCKYDY